MRSSVAAFARATCGQSCLVTCSSVACRPLASSLTGPRGLGVVREQVGSVLGFGPSASLPGMRAECGGAMRETAACPDEASEKPKCQFSPWQEWTRCDKTCDDGQTFRTRPFTHPGPAADIWACQQSIIHEAKPCKLKACHDCSTLGKMESVVGVLY